MEVVCINKNGWHSFRGNVYAYVEYRIGLSGYPKYGEKCWVNAIGVDSLGDAIYYINGYGNIGLDAEAFIDAQTFREAHENLKENKV